MTSAMIAQASPGSISAERSRLEASRPFDLAHDLPMRASLLRLANDDRSYW